MGPTRRSRLLQGDLITRAPLLNRKLTKSEKAGIKRDATMGSTVLRPANQASSVQPAFATGKEGQHLATDDQCCDGEDYSRFSLNKNHSALQRQESVSNDDDVWVVPYDDGPSQPNRLKTQFEDTKL